jgi:hypothetical protein
MGQEQVMSALLAGSFGIIAKHTRLRQSLAQVGLYFLNAHPILANG